MNVSDFYLPLHSSVGAAEKVPIFVASSKYVWRTQLILPAEMATAEKICAPRRSVHSSVYDESFKSVKRTLTPRNR